MISEAEAFYQINMKCERSAPVASIVCSSVLRGVVNAKLGVHWLYSVYSVLGKSQIVMCLSVDEITQYVV